MPMYMYECECGNHTRKLVKNINDKVTCDKCDSVMSRDIIGSTLNQMFDNIPGGYAANKQLDQRMSPEGQLQEAAMLAGETQWAY